MISITIFLLLGTSFAMATIILWSVWYPSFRNWGMG